MPLSENLSTAAPDDGEQTRAREDGDGKRRKRRKTREDNDGVRSPLEQYLRDINATPLLSADQEKELARRIEDGDGEARDHMVRANLRLVVNIAREFQGRGLSLQDLIEEGNLGLLRAVEGFDPSMNTRFSTYASYWIRQSCKKAFINTAKTIRVPAYIYELLSKWRAKARALREELGHDPTPQETAKALGIKKKLISLVAKALDATESRHLSLSTSPDEGDDWPSFADITVDPKAADPAETVLAEEDIDHLLSLIEGLDPRERMVLEGRFEFDGKKITLRELGEKLGITREGTRQIESKALQKLTVAMGEDVSPQDPQPSMSAPPQHLAYQQVISAPGTGFTLDTILEGQTPKIDSNRERAPAAVNGHTLEKPTTGDRLDNCLTLLSQHFANRRQHKQQAGLDAIAQQLIKSLRHWRDPLATPQDHELLYAYMMGLVNIAIANFPILHQRCQFRFLNIMEELRGHFHTLDLQVDPEEELLLRFRCLEVMFEEGPRRAVPYALRQASPPYQSSTLKAWKLEKKYRMAVALLAEAHILSATGDHRKELVRLLGRRPWNQFHPTPQGQTTMPPQGNTGKISVGGGTDADERQPTPTDPEAHKRWAINNVLEWGKSAGSMPVDIACAWGQWHDIFAERLGDAWAEGALNELQLRKILISAAQQEARKLA